MHIHVQINIHIVVTYVYMYNIGVYIYIYRQIHTTLYTHILFVFDFAGGRGARVHFIFRL